MESPSLEFRPIIRKLNAYHSILQISVFFSSSYRTYLQTVQVLMRRLVTSQLIWIYTGCKYRPLQRAVGLNGLRYVAFTSIYVAHDSSSKLLVGFSWNLQIIISIKCSCAYCHCMRVSTSVWERCFPKASNEYILYVPYIKPRYTLGHGHQKKNTVWLTLLISNHGQKVSQN